MYDQMITLVSENVVIDAYGDQTIQREYRDVFAEEKSIGQSEFYQANAAGMRPEIKFILADRLEYSGEKILKYMPFGETDTQEYNVVRTFSPGTTIELTCRRGVDRS